MSKKGNVIGPASKQNWSDEEMARKDGAELVVSAT